MASLSPKQLAMAWINNCFDPERIDPENDELEAINGGNELSDKILEAAKATIKEEIAKMKPRFQGYVDKYVLPRVKPVEVVEPEESDSQVIDNNVS